ncbi:MAG TPA: hypothetical protein VKS21_04465, partial [Spirochaetota bacterium]|nr:hypothetical protein [Spirochaetota bacterium]
MDFNNTEIKVNFEKNYLGYYTQNRINADFKNVKWSLAGNRGKIVEDAEFGKVLEVYFPEGAVGPQQGGISFVRSLAPAKEYYLDYYLMFNKDFSFRQGGKLPGMTSGGAKYTGGHKPYNGDGWSARFMWVNTSLVVYLYYIDMEHKYGESIPLKADLSTDAWHRITQHIVLNDPGQSNALIEIWFDEQKAGRKENFRLRKGEQGLIDAFYFSTFHGGATPDWAPLRDSFIYFDNFYI